PLPSPTLFRSDFNAPEQFRIGEQAAHSVLFEELAYTIDVDDDATFLAAGLGPADAADVQALSEHAVGAGKVDAGHILQRFRDCVCLLGIALYLINDRDRLRRGDGALVH